VGDDPVEQQPVAVAREQLERRRVARRRLTPDPDHRDVGGADVAVRVDRDRAEVDEGIRLDDDAAHARHSERGREGARHAGAVVHDVGAPSRVLAYARDEFLVGKVGRVQRQRRSQRGRGVEPRRQEVDRDELAAAHEARLDQMAQAERADT